MNDPVAQEAGGTWSSGVPSPEAAVAASHGHQQGSLMKLAVGAIGVVFGDIGTSPLYAFRETFAGASRRSGIQIDPVHIHGVLSLMFWSMMIVVTFKYVLTIMKADNKGEGGSLALLALIKRRPRGRQVDRHVSSCSACSRPRCSTAIR